MGALGHYLEAEGVPTAQISLVREHTEPLAPPRALWVPFMLGRPFGVPGDAHFQRDVLLALLALFERVDGPVLEDYPREAPQLDPNEALGELVCPVSFPSYRTDGPLRNRLLDEAAQLHSWHELARALRRRTTLGATGLAPSALAEYVAAWLEPGHERSFREGVSPADALKLACDELRTFCYEAKSMQPGQPSSDEIDRWFWHETAAGEAILAIRSHLARSTDPAARALAGSSLVPRAVDLALTLQAQVMNGSREQAR